MEKIVLIGGYPKGFDEPFHIKTKSGRVLKKILGELKINPELFNLWRNQKEEDSRIFSKSTKSSLDNYRHREYKIIALGRYIEKALKDNNYKCEYLPHPASRDIKYIKALKEGLSDL